jgi:hypothetical protein
MARYLIFPTMDAALARSNAQALAKGCDGVTTKYWWGQIEHPTNGQAALVIGDAPYGTDGLTDAEVSVLKTQDQLNAAGWFPPSQP